mmetsp:Transcript_101784/g.311277  ORF Transcript_101784/g.311277 Transcript_101784/m.311277 type:complete len:262 (+) Transcript_101784:106-891(+)
MRERGPAQAGPRGRHGLQRIRDVRLDRYPHRGGHRPRLGPGDARRGRAASARRPHVPLQRRGAERRIPPAARRPRRAAGADVHIPVAPGHPLRHVLRPSLPQGAEDQPDQRGPQGAGAARGHERGGPAEEHGRPADRHRARQEDRGARGGGRHHEVLRRRGVGRGAHREPHHAGAGNLSARGGRGRGGHLLLGPCRGRQGRPRRGRCRQLDHRRRRPRQPPAGRQRPGPGRGGGAARAHGGGDAHPGRGADALARTRVRDP